jgi:hypothetical protein
MKEAIHGDLHNFTNKRSRAVHYVLPGENSKKYFAFQTAESPDKIILKRKDVMYVITDESDARKKKAIMRDGTRHTFMKYTMLELLKIAPHLLQPNHSELVAIDIIVSKGHEHIIVTLPTIDKKQKMVIIGRAFRESFNLQFNKL